MPGLEDLVGHRGGGEGGPQRAAEVENGVDHLIARLASRRRGVVTRAELLAAGVTRRQIERRLAAGRLHPLHRGVYAVGHLALHPQARLVAGLLAAGPDPVLGHRSAAEHWRMLAPTDGPVHVIRAGSRPTRRPGLVLHRVVLEPAERRVQEGLPVTSPTRSLLDLAASEPEHLEAAVNEARVLRLIRPGELKPLAGRRGVRPLRLVLEDRPGFTRSNAERRLLGLLRAAKLPRPETNARVGPWEVDLLWRDARVAVEVDGYAAHSGPRAFERDRRKDAALQLAGYAVLRISARRLRDEPEWVLATVAGVLAAASRPGR